MAKYLRYLLVLILALHVGYSQNQGDRCTDNYTKAQGRCALASKCQSARDDFYNNGIQPTFCSLANDAPLVCCRDGTNIYQTGSQQNSNSAPVWGSASNNLNTPAQNDGRRISERKCVEYSRGVTQTVDFLPLLPVPEAMSISAAKCNYAKVELIVGGESADLGEFPHMATIGWPAVAGGYLFKCGGSLISERFVLTAGHCLRNPRDPTVSDPDPAVVRLGDHNIDPRVNDGANPVEIPIKRIHKHPEYMPPKRYNDIGLLELATDVDFDNNIRPACLWNRNGFGSQTNALATGWGVTNTRTLATSNELQKVSLSLYQNDYCDRLLYNLRNRNWKGFRESQLCAGELRGGKDTCQGDSGGPLQLASKENHCIFHIIGVTSFGNKCAESGQPAIYTRVSHFLDWIESVVWPQ